MMGLPINPLSLKEPHPDRPVKPTMDRRHFLALLSGFMPALLLPAAATADNRPRKSLPGGGASLPAIGMGTWLTFDVGDDYEAMRRRREAAGTRPFALSRRTRSRSTRRSWILRSSASIGMAKGSRGWRSPTSGAT